jgi:hypothetical protein
MGEFGRSKHQSIHGPGIPERKSQKVLSIANQDQCDLILAYVLTGARKNELHEMVWADADMEKKTYKLKTLKTGN